ncbi:MAG: hypothetical protein IKR90_04365, partial [Clostridia bacterium]|nr:hypothetical protein [Clostridia bacterium]
TYYYHTWRDTPDRFSPETVGKGFDVILGVIDKIAAFQSENAPAEVQEAAAEAPAEAEAETAETEE